MVIDKHTLTQIATFVCTLKDTNKQETAIDLIKKVQSSQDLMYIIFNYLGGRYDINTINNILCSQEFIITLDKIMKEGI